MKQKAIKILGMSSNMGPTSTIDGQCMDIVNARNVEGVVKPVTPAKKIANLSDSENVEDPQKIGQIYFHDKARKYIAIYDSNRLIVYNEDFTYMSSISPSSGDINKLDFIGNIMIASCKYDTVFFLFRDNVYESLGSKPPMPKIDITLSRTIYKHLCEVPYNPDATKETFYMYVLKGLIDNCIYKGNKQSHYIDRTLVRFALRMYDGSYVLHSGIFLIEDDCEIWKKDEKTEPIFTESNILYNITSGPSSSSKVNIWVKMFKLVYRFYNIQNLNKWRDIITSIDVFTTRSIRNEKTIEGVYTYDSEYSESLGVYSQNINDVDTIGSKVSYYEKDTDLNTKIISESLFYKVASFDLDGKIISGYEIDVSDENLVLNDRLTDDANTHDTFTSIAPYVYNRRLHLAGCDQVLFKGYDTTQFIEYGYFDNYGDPKDLKPQEKDKTEVRIYTFLKTTEGDRVVQVIEPQGYVPKCRLLTYPDIRAYQMQIVYRDKSDNKIKSRTYPLIKHPNLNLAYFMNPMNEGFFYKPGVSIDSGIPEKQLTSFPNYDNLNVIERRNVLKVSGVDNPFFFPSESTYIVGDGDIIGVASAATALSTGQAGQFPLYVFTSRGIFSMEVDTTGKTVYSRSSPMREDVCNNYKSITPALGGVFFSSDQGIMFISGSEVLNFTEGIKYNSTTSDKMLEEMYKVSLIDKIQESINEFMAGDLDVAYMYHNNEVVFSRPDKNYSYCFNINSKTWHRITGGYDSFINQYPKMYAVKDAQIYDLDIDDQDQSNNILIISHPMLLESTSHKKIIQAVLRSDLYVNSVAGFYLLGSLDGTKYNLVALKEIVDIDSVKRCSDLITKMKRSKSYKYFAFAIIGNLKVRTCINHVGVTFDDSMTNRIR